MVIATPRPLYPRERPGTRCKGGWVGPRVGLDGCGKSRRLPGFDPRTVQPVASRYTDPLMIQHFADYCAEYKLLLFPFPPLTPRSVLTEATKDTRSHKAVQCVPFIPVLSTTAVTRYQCGSSYAFSRRTVTMEAVVRSHISPCEICGG